jgi:ABC-type antimicrobial peptide transport system permease subunit
VALAAKGVLRRPGRAVLTVLAVALAASLLTALLTIARTAQTRVLSELSKGGPLAGIKVAAAEPDPDQVDNDNARPGAPKDMDDDALHRIRALPGVKAVVPVSTARMLVLTPDSDVPAFGDNMVGVDLRRAGRLPISILAGRLPGAGSATEVAVTQGYLERLKLKRTDAAKVVGTEIELASPRLFPRQGQPRFRGLWRRAFVVGVVAQEASPGQLLAPMEQVTAAREWTAAGPPDGDLAQPTSRYSGLFVTAGKLDQVGKVRARITAVGYSTSAPENLIASVQRYLHVVEIVLTGIGAIALVIASLGITNALLAAVRERRREIGVLKAVGARDRDVLRTFLVEAGVLGFLGGVIGTAAGWGIASAVGSVVNGYLARQGLAGVQLGLPLAVLAGGVLGSTLLALMAGSLPAWRAARLPAREAVAGG